MSTFSRSRSRLYTTRLKGHFGARTRRSTQTTSWSMSLTSFPSSTHWKRLSLISSQLLLQRSTIGAQSYLRSPRLWRKDQASLKQNLFSSNTIKNISQTPRCLRVGRREDRQIGSYRKKTKQVIDKMRESLRRTIIRRMNKGLVIW